MDGGAAEAAAFCRAARRRRIFPRTAINTAMQNTSEHTQAPVTAFIVRRMAASPPNWASMAVCRVSTLISAPARPSIFAAACTGSCMRCAFTALAAALPKQ